MTAEFIFILALLAIGMMFSLVSSHPLTEEEEQKLLGGPFTSYKDEKQDFKNPFPSNEGEKPNFFKNPFPANEGDKPNFFKNPFPSNEGDKPNFFKNPFPPNEGDKPNSFKNPFPSNEGDKPNSFKNSFPSNEGDKPNFFKNPFPTGPAADEQLPPYSMRGFNYWLTQYNPRATLTCDKFPRVCREKGSPGPDCCKKKCVNVMNDNLNCGECGTRCRFGEMCCGGTCASVLYDQKNCGACKKRCKKGSFCNFGMCNYA